MMIYIFYDKVEPVERPFWAGLTVFYFICSCAIGLPIIFWWLWAKVPLTRIQYDQEFNRKWGALFENKRTNTKPQVMFYFIFIVRRFIYVGIAFGLVGRCYFQLQILIACHFFVTAYQGYFKPMPSMPINWIEASNEVHILAGTCCTMLFTDWVHDPEVKYYYGWWFIIILIDQMIWNLFFVTYELCRLLRLLWIKYWPTIHKYLMIIWKYLKWIWLWIKHYMKILWQYMKLLWQYMRLLWCYIKLWWRKLREYCCEPNDDWVDPTPVHEVRLHINFDEPPPPPLEEVEHKVFTPIQTLMIEEEAPAKEEIEMPKMQEFSFDVDFPKPTPIIEVVDLEPPHHHHHEHKHKHKHDHGDIHQIEHKTFEPVHGHKHEHNHVHEHKTFEPISIQNINEPSFGTNEFSFREFDPKKQPS
jgi:hypothetical protein